jgi:glycosyltransferase involved in cell wall biosynthesis
MKVALVHDDLVQWGGAERMLVGLSKVFADADIFTSVYDENNKLIKENFKDKKIYTSFIQKIPGWRSLYKAFLPLYPIAFEQFDFTEYDLVISQTTRFAKSITKPETTHICYCHTPPRFLYDFTKNKVSKNPYFKWLRRYDQISSKRVDKWIAGSKNAQKRLKDIYGVESEVIYPYVDTEISKDIEIFNGDYILVVSRLNKYKNVDLVVRAANELKIPLKIVGVGPELGYLKSISGEQVEFLGNIDDKVLLKVISGCWTLVVAGEEDFGLTPLEAQAFGKPVIALGKGGSLETVIEGQTGYLFEEENMNSLKRALINLKTSGYNEKACKEQAGRFSKEKFTKAWSTIL